jgi:rRNA maturation RNase YbeY
MIHFHYHNTPFCVDELKATDLVSNLVRVEGYLINEVSVILCDDEYLLVLNRSFLNHDYYTDILTFDYSEKNALYGELYISFDRVKENSSLLNTSVNQELMRVIVHGFLHLCGYKDETPVLKELMTRKEDYYLSLINV